jgi:hypothetical protein
MDGIRYAMGEEELTTMGLTAAILCMRMHGHRDVDARRRDSVTPVWCGTYCIRNPITFNASE